MFGLPWTTSFFIFCYPVILFVATLVYTLSGSYEGKKEEEEYGLDDWYITF